MQENKGFLKIPSGLLKEFILITIINFIFGVVMDTSSFLVQFSKNAMEAKAVTLSLVLIALSFTASPFRDFVRVFLSERRNILKEHMDVELNLKSSAVLLRTKGKVIHYSKSKSFEEVMPSITINETVNKYVDNYWRNYVFFFEKGADVFSSISMFIAMIVVSTLEIENTLLFIILLISAATFSTFFAWKRFKARNKYRDPKKTAFISKNEQKQNIMELEPICQEQISFMTDNLLKASNEWYSLWRAENKEFNMLHAFESLGSMVFSLAILFLKLNEVGGVENATIEMLLSVTSLVTIYWQFVSRIKSLVDVVDNYKDIKENQKTYQADFDNIMSVYREVTENDGLKAVGLNSMYVSPFDVCYARKGEEQTFELVSQKQIHIKNGDFVMLTGKTASGKTTLMKLITGIIRLDGFSLEVEKDGDGYIKSIFHPEQLQIGTNSILTELTFGKVDYDKEKLIEILKGVHLYEELKERSEDVIKYLENTTITSGFSSGQKQRFTLVRTLFNIDEDTQIIVFDEATNKMDDEFSLKVIKFIRNYLKDTVVLFATHQVNIIGQVATKQLHFSKKDFNYQVVEI